MIEEIDFFDFKIVNTDKLTNLAKVNLKNVDLVNISSKLTFGFWRPPKIIWRLKIIHNDPFSYIASLKEKKKIKKLLKKSPWQIILKEQINLNLFLQWLKIYQEVMTKKPRGIIKIDKSWWQKKKNQKQKVGGVFVFNHNQLKGGSLFLEKKEEAKCLNIAYSAYKTQSGDYYSYRSLAEYYFLKYGIEKKYSTLGHGSDTNLYGMHLRPGIFEFKNRYGYKPKQGKKGHLVSTFFLNKKKFAEEVLFVYYKKKEPRLALLADKPKNQIISKKYIHAGLPIDIFNFSQEIRTHKQFLKKV